MTSPSRTLPDFKAQLAQEEIQYGNKSVSPLKDKPYAIFRQQAINVHPIIGNRNQTSAELEEELAAAEARRNVLLLDRVAKAKAKVDHVSLAIRCHPSSARLECKTINDSVIG